MPKFTKSTKLKKSYFLGLTSSARRIKFLPMAQSNKGENEMCLTDPQRKAMRFFELAKCYWRPTFLGVPAVPFTDAGRVINRNVAKALRRKGLVEGTKDPCIFRCTRKGWVWVAENPQVRDR